MGVYQGMTKAIGVAGDFEEALAKIQKKSGATAEQMANIKEQIFELGRQIPVTHQRSRPVSSVPRRRVFRSTS